MIISPKKFQWTEVAPQLSLFEVRVVGADGTELAKSDIPLGNPALTSEGNVYTLDIVAADLGPNGTHSGIIVGNPYTFTVQAVYQPDGGGDFRSDVVASAPFTFTEVVENPTNLTVLP